MASYTTLDIRVRYRRLWLMRAILRIPVARLRLAIGRVFAPCIGIDLIAGGHVNRVRLSQYLS